jgi:hypothetical protein
MVERIDETAASSSVRRLPGFYCGLAAARGIQTSGKATSRMYWNSA